MGAEESNRPEMSMAIDHKGPMKSLFSLAKGEGAGQSRKTKPNHLRKNKQTKKKTLLSVEGFPSGSDGKESACNVGNPGSIPGLGRSRRGHGKYSCLENSMDKGA